MSTPAPEPDQVDRIMAAWKREVPGLDLTPLAVLSRVTRLARHLDKVRRRAFARYNLESFEFDVLAALRRAGAPYQMSPSQLISETYVTSGTMTNRIDRLVAKGLVARMPDPRDRRGVLVALTDPGREAADAAMGELLDAEHALLEGLTPQECQQAANTLRTLVRGFTN